MIATTKDQSPSCVDIAEAAEDASAADRIYVDHPVDEAPAALYQPGRTHTHIHRVQQSCYTFAAPRGEEICRVRLEHDLYDGNEAHYIETGERLDYYLVPTLAERQRFKDKEPGLVWSPREYPARPN